MRVFFDTSVLVAACEQGHPHYGQARPAFLRITARKDQGYMSFHSIAEMYAALTRLPVQPRIHPAEAARIITDNILPHLETVTVGKRDYTEALRVVAHEGWPGAKIYDVLLIGCAARSGVERIYTFNLAGFRQLAPNLEGKICAPS